MSSQAQYFPGKPHLSDVCHGVLVSLDVLTNCKGIHNVAFGKPLVSAIAVCLL